MAQTISAPSALSSRRLVTVGLALCAALALGFAARDRLTAQVAGDRGIPPVAATGDIEIMGIAVDVTGKNADDAREAGWRLAQRKGWEKLGGPKMSDSQLQGMVSAIIVQKEQIGPYRYVATLGVVFDRTRAGQFLGGEGEISRSAPMLLMPILSSGGTQTVFEVRNPWQQAWAEFQTGASAVDYVRPVGSGGDSLLLTYGQAGRRSRLWWRNILDQFGAADVIFAIAHLEHQWPGGPVVGRFTARFGPDNRYLGSFTLRAKDDQGVPAMLGQALVRFDRIFTGALQAGLLRPDPTLVTQSPELDPAIAALIEIGRRAELEDRAVTDAIIGGARGGEAQAPIPAQTQAVASFTVQVATPDAASIDAGLSALRGTAGVRGASTSSIAIGGVSVMSVSYAGSLDQLAAALRARGWQVVQGNNALSIRR